MVEQVITAALTAGVTGVVAGVASSYTTVIALKTDIGWIKKIIEQFDDRLKVVENR